MFFQILWSGAPNLKQSEPIFSVFRCFVRVFRVTNGALQSFSNLNVTLRIFQPTEGLYIRKKLEHFFQGVSKLTALYSEFLNVKT